MPRCACGFQMKSGVVLFGEALPADAIDAAFDHAARADLMLVIGSSLLVAPVSQLPRAVLDNGGTLAILTESETPYDDVAQVRLHGRAGRADAGGPGRARCPGAGRAVIRSGNRPGRRPGRAELGAGSPGGTGAASSGPVGGSRPRARARNGSEIAEMAPESR